MLYLRPFSHPRDVKRWGKTRIVERLGLEQSEHDKQGYVHELEGIDEVPIGANNSSAETDNTTRDASGNLLSALVTGGVTYLETEKTKAEAEKLQAQAAATQATAAVKAGMGTVMPWVIGLLAVGLFMTMGMKKGRH